MTRFRTLIAIGMIFMLLSPAACGCLGGGNGGKTEVQSTSTTTTLGQELTDLQKAHDSGAINDEQYEKAKQELLKKYKAD